MLGRCSFERRIQASRNLPWPVLDLRFSPNRCVKISLMHISNKSIVYCLFVTRAVKYDLIYYYRHNQNSMRFYSLITLPFDADIDVQHDQPVPSPLRTSTNYDFTLPTTRSGINSTVMNQVCSGILLSWIGIRFYSSTWPKSWKT
jgi:hypothetical protein